MGAIDYGTTLALLHPSFRLPTFNHTNLAYHAAASWPLQTSSPARITRRDRRPQILQLGFEKGVGEDQRLDRLTRITAAGRDGPI